MFCRVNLSTNMSSSAASTGVDALATLKAQERILNQTLLMLENQKERLIVEETDLLHYLEYVYIYLL